MATDHVSVRMSGDPPGAEDSKLKSEGNGGYGSAAAAAAEGNSNGDSDGLSQQQKARGSHAFGQQ